MGWDADLSRASAVTPKWASVPHMGSDQALVVVSNKSEGALPSAALTGLPGSQRSQGRPGNQRRQGTVHRAWELLPLSGKATKPSRVLTLCCV